MLIGSELPYDFGWHVIEGDLHDIHRRVREYDKDAALVWNSESGQLGLARFNPMTVLEPGGAYLFSVVCMDPATRLPLTGEPDARVLSHQRIADGHQIGNLTTWTRRRRDILAAQRAKEKAQRMDWSRAQAKELMWRRSRVDLGRKPFASIPKEIT